MSESSCIIIGASHAGSTLALQLRKEGWSGSIKLIGAEDHLPYHRPPLSKDLLAGEKTVDGIRLRPAKVYQDNDIELLLNTRVESIDADAHTITLEDSQVLSYNKLALCTGSIVRKIPLGESLHNIFYIRTADDVAALAEQLQKGRRAVVIGAGYVGLEAAAVMAQRGVQVTVLEMAERILQRVTSATMSEYMAQLHRSHGVNIVTGTQVEAIEGQDVVEKIRCGGGEEYAADFVVVGIGVLPNTRLAAAAGLEVNGNEGLLVNEFTETSAPDIYAAGDCTCHPSSIYDRVLRLESVQNANDQARITAANICGRRVAYDSVPWFWSDQYQEKLQMVGLSQGFDQLVSRGDTSNREGKGFALFYLKEGVVIAADCVGRPKEFMVAKQMVQAKLPIDAARLQDESVEPASFRAQ